jgi:hypothetical protein
LPFQDEEAVQLYQLKWGGVSHRAASRGPWEWLADALDISRVQTTLRAFPIDDSIDPYLAVLPTESPELNWTEQDKGAFSEELLPDQRYSPGFLLPLVLAALEDAMDYNVSSMENVCIQGHTVAIAQRLCDRGAVALSLMALCSNCPHIRRVSVSILALMIMIIHSKEAIGSALWRDRPQLALILDSVQRALASRPVESHEKPAVPQLPAVSALFLARASLIASRPGDRLFASINRVFLRIPHDHGAFQDLWRLPAFISLLCSFADDPEQVASERVWALHLLKDGFLNESCYKPLIACHGAELLLTSVDNLRLRPAGDKHGECALLLDALEAIVDKGGEKCEEHFIQRLGLLSFLRSLVMARPTFTLLRTKKSHIAFLRLAESSIKKASTTLSPEDFATATAGFAQYLIGFCLTSIQNSGGREDSETTIVIRHTGTTLIALAKLPSAIGDKRVLALEPGILRADGICLASASEFISVIKKSDLPLVLAAICNLPLRCTMEDETNAASFCMQMLRLVQVIDQHEIPFVGVMLTISKIAKFFNNSFDRENAILRLLLQLRNSNARSEDSLGAWSSCLSQLLLDIDDGAPGRQEEEVLTCLARKLARSKTS